MVSSLRAGDVLSAEQSPNDVVPSLTALTARSVAASLIEVAS
jgi:hypothetical protein